MNLEECREEIETDISLVIDSLVNNSTLLSDGLEGIRVRVFRNVLKPINQKYQISKGRKEKVSIRVLEIAKDDLKSRGFSHSSDVYNLGRDNQRYAYFVK